MAIRVRRAVTPYKRAVQACLFEVGLPAPIWQGGCAFAPDKFDTGQYWDALSKAIDLCEDLWTDQDYEDVTPSE